MGDGSLLRSTSECSNQIMEKRFADSVANLSGSRVLLALEGCSALFRVRVEFVKQGQEGDVSKSGERSCSPAD